MVHQTILRRVPYCGVCVAWCSPLIFLFVERDILRGLIFAGRNGCVHSVAAEEAIFYPHERRWWIGGLRNRLRRDTIFGKIELFRVARTYPLPTLGELAKAVARRP